MNDLNLHELAASPVAERVLVLLAHFLWQGTLLAGIAAGASVALVRRSAEVRYVMHSAVMLAMLLAPGATAALLGPLEPTDVPLAVATAIPAGAVETAAAPVDIPLPTRPPRTDWAAWLLGAYGLGVAALSLRLARAMFIGRRLRREAEKVVSPALLEAYERQVRALEIRWTPALEFSREVAAPALVGLLRPAILLPLSLASEMSPEQVELLLAHELAHWRRLDPLAVLAQRLAETWLFFHPGVWYVSRQMSHEREYCCDDLVISAGGSAVSYADALVRTAELTLGISRPSALVLSAAGESSQFGGRVRRLLGAREDRSLRLLSSGGVFSLVTAVVLVTVGGALVAQTSTPASKPSDAVAWVGQGAKATPADVKLSLQFRCELPKQPRRQAVSLGTDVLLAYNEQATLDGFENYRIEAEVLPVPREAQTYQLLLRVKQREGKGWRALSTPRIVTRVNQPAIWEMQNDEHRLRIEATISPVAKADILDLASSDDVPRRDARELAIMAALEALENAGRQDDEHVRRAISYLRQHQFLGEQATIAERPEAGARTSKPARSQADTHAIGAIDPFAPTRPSAAFFGEASETPASQAAKSPAAEAFLNMAAQSGNRPTTLRRNLQLLLLLLQAFEENHNRWPASLSELKGDYANYEMLLLNPRTGDNPGYHYRKPVRSDSPMLWELKGGKIDAEGATGYPDGRIETSGKSERLSPTVNEAKEVRLFTAPDAAPAIRPSAPLKPPVSLDPLAAPLTPAGNPAASGPVDDAEYLRRVTLDLKGRLPTEAEAKRFLEWPQENRRSRLVNEMVEAANPFKDAELAERCLAEIHRQSQEAMLRREQKARDEALARTNAESAREKAEFDILEALLANHQKECQRLVELQKQGLATDEAVSRAEREMLEVKLRVMKAKVGR